MAVHTARSVCVSELLKGFVVICHISRMPQCHYTAIHPCIQTMFIGRMMTLPSL